MIQLLPELVNRVSKVIASNLNVERLTVVDGGSVNGSGCGIPHLVSTLAGSVNSFFKQMKTLSGMDLVKLMEERCQMSGKAI